MQRTAFSLYLGLFLVLYSAINGYIFLHIIPLLIHFDLSFIGGSIVFWCLAFSYTIGELIQFRRSSVLSDTLILIGSFWFFAMVHFIIGSLVYDILWLISRWTPWLGSINLFTTGIILAEITIGITIITMIAGYINALYPVVRRLTLQIDKKNSLTPSLRIAVASDIHLGPINGQKHGKRLVKILNRLKPDLILLPGDILDGEVDPVIRRDLGKYLVQLDAKYGVYAILGNHEYIGGMHRAADYIRAHDITLLRDEVLEVAGIALIGRDDTSCQRFGHTRAPLDSLMQKVSAEMPTILLDHQPRHLEEADHAKVDIQLSGHTHNGQLWPLNFIVSQLFELACGYKKKTHTHVIVSSGFGTWGPPIRTNRRAEVWLLEVEFRR